MKVNFLTKCGVLSFCMLAGAIHASPDELPPAIQADRYLLEAKIGMENNDYESAVDSLERFLTVATKHGIEIPDVFWFTHAQALQRQGHSARAVESVKRYLIAAGQEGKHYLAALELLAVAEKLPSTPAPVVAPQAPAMEADAADTRHSKVFADALASGGTGPDMVIVPNGSFRMGCLLDDNSCFRNEKPVHNVRISQQFALSRYEVTFAQWDACVSVGGCRGYHPDDEGWGRGNLPVINVSWDDARAYVSWLSKESGKAYRLPSESEWEYAARAGSTTKYSWGNAIGTNRANCDNDDCGDSWEYTAPVGSFAPNAFGLYDMHGNVWEWVEDCWNDTYSGAPADGSVWRIGDCAGRVLRGGSWSYYPRSLRAALRIRNSSGLRFSSLGFRVARTLAP